MRRILSEADLKLFRDRVCAVATELLATHGYDGFNMRELATRLGVSAMTTYRYFDSKDAIFAALRVQAFHRLLAALEAAIDLSGQPFERVVAISRAYLDFARDEPIHYRLMFDFSPQRGARSAELTSAEGRVFQILADQAGLFSPGRSRSTAMCERLARTFWATLHGLAALFAIQTFHDSERDGVLADLAQGFASPPDHPDLEYQLQVSTRARSPIGTRHPEGALPPAWMSLSATE